MRVYLDTVGCRLNQSEIEQIAGRIRAMGHELVESLPAADLVVVNTCSVTSKAASDSRQLIRQAAKAGSARIVVTGCWATLEPEIAAALPGVEKVVPNDEKDNLVKLVFGDPNTDDDHEKKKRIPIPGPRSRTRAFIKAQDGCNNHCSFCVTRVARGKSRSRDAGEIIVDIRSALEGGTKEVILTGVQLGSWGQDFQKPQNLRHLIERALRETDLPRLRLSSLEPWDLDDGFFSLWRETRLCRHLHLPLQSGSDAVLRRMGRRVTKEKYAYLVEMARSVSPSISITTDMIIGFPGETDHDFQQSLDFVQRIGFSGGHVFNYSPRPLTQAAQFTDDVVPSVRKTRSTEMRRLFSDLASQYRQSLLGSTCVVLWETGQECPTHDWQMAGLSDHYVKVYATTRENAWNQLATVRLDDQHNNGVSGTVIPLV